MSKSVRDLLGKRIKEVRFQKGLTQEDLSVKSRIDYKYMQRIEGKTPPNVTIETIGKIARALNVSIGDLIDF